MTADTQATDTSDKPDYDSPWKEALERFFPEFLALLFPAIHAEIDWSKGVQFLDKEFQKIVCEAKTTRRYADKLVGVTRRDETPVWRNSGDSILNSFRAAPNAPTPPQIG
ncbi:hypothetical protein Thiowin_04128 [Thiorhodovibrio winogradskyi]|uniref:Uncharacterized protein n=1 Tax=Thiorhodovibrio winogradskyi TaxID=77007 RepID=A0ABZ0SEH2_9GAMM|nr:hypothetical protein [Thiorhodovibrio winogradskyi]